MMMKSRTVKLYFSYTVEILIIRKLKMSLININDCQKLYG